MRLAGFVTALTACGSSGKTPDAASALDAVNSDAVASCDVTKPFGSITNLAAINTHFVDDWGWLSADARTIYFTSTVPSGSDLGLYQATRPSTSASFSTPQPLVATSTGVSQQRPVVTADGLTLFAHSSDGHIYVATRTSPAAQFGSLALVPGIASTDVDEDPWIDAQGLTMYFASTRNTGSPDIFRTTRIAPYATFDPPVAVDELDTNSFDHAPVLSADGLEIFFASDRATTSNSRDDIWHATRAAVTDSFGTPTMVAELSGNTTADFPTWLSADRCTLLFSSDRAGGNGSYDIWIATRPQ